MSGDWDVEEFSDRKYHFGAASEAQFARAREAVLAVVERDEQGRPRYLVEENGSCDARLNAFLVDAAAHLLTTEFKGWEMSDDGSPGYDAVRWFILGTLAAVSNLLTCRWFPMTEEP